MRNKPQGSAPLTNSKNPVKIECIFMLDIFVFPFLSNILLKEMLCM